MTAQQRKEAIQKLIKLYEADLGPILDVGPKFDIKRLPSQVQSIVKLVTAKAPTFSNIAATAVANYGISHVLGQLRPKINSPVFSSNLIGCNVYSIVISNSGTGKSSSSNTMKEIFKPALEMVDGYRKLNQINQAKQMALKLAQQENQSATIDDITPAMYEQFVKPLPRITAPSTSTRGGMSRLLDRLQQEEFSNLSIIIDELGLALKSGNTLDEVLGFLTESFDMGNNEAPEFKSEEVKEASIEGMYTNLLAHTSPKIVFEHDSVREKLLMLFHTALSRRCFFSFPDEDETCENNPIPDTIEATRQLTKIRHDVIANAAPDISDNMTKIVRKMLSSSSERMVKFSHDAGQLYSDYFDYCVKRSEIMEDSSILQIELAGRSFRLGKLAALWALLEGSNIITREIYESVIYYAEYNAKYLDKFVKLTNSQPFELLAQVFKAGKIQFITLDSALTNGYINRVTKDFKEILDPLNSILRSDGTCTYSEESKAFIYTPYKRVEPTTSNGDLCMSYTILPDNTPKDDRIKYLNSFDKCRCDLGLTNVVNLLKKDSIYNPFRYADTTDTDGNTIHNKRNQDTIISSTKLIVLDIDKSEVPMETMHEFLEEYKHILATTSDKSNKLKFRIILPINVELDGSDTQLFAYVTKRIAADMLVQADKVSFNPAQPFYGYLDSEVILQEEGSLFDITPFLTEYANRAEIEQPKPILHTRPKTEQGRKNHVNKLLDNINTVFSYVIEAKHGEGSFMMARASMHMRDEFFTKSEYVMAMNYINSLWESPMPQTRLERTLFQTYLPQMEED